MTTTNDSLTLSVPGFHLVGHPGEVAPANGQYRCLRCGAVLWRLRKGRRFPDCPSQHCPTVWLWHPLER
jgi:hypothetical protein